MEMSDNGVDPTTLYEGFSDPVNKFEEWVPMCEEELKTVIGKGATAAQGAIGLVMESCEAAGGV
ncbi:Zinc finger, SWIM-type [Sesbania bispinosa]|nr:Zinc finger, SWIM-type [Sesbania bispinosa]